LAGLGRARPLVRLQPARLASRLRPALPLAGVVVAAAFLRVWQLTAVGYNSDESIYAGQAASIAGDEQLRAIFPVFRAHPLLFQTLLSLVFAGGIADTAGRLLSACFGIATVLLVYRLGRLLYGPAVGTVAALLLALMPYHVVVTRQVLLDGPMVFFATAALYCVARFCRDEAPGWLHAGAATAGLTVLTKETGVVLVVGLYAFFALSPHVRLRLRDGLAALGILTAITAVFPLTLLLSGKGAVGQRYLLWQLFRRSNHSLLFYPRTVPVAVGLLVVALALAGFWLLRRQSGWRERLLACWGAAPIVLFEIWPVKGYQYLLATAPVFAVLAARVLVLGPIPRAIGLWRERQLRWAAAAVVAVSLAIPSWQRVNPAPASSFLAGAGGLPAGREAGRWIEQNLPRGATLLTVGPSMANVIAFYGHHRAVGLSVSPNPLNRNPSYVPVDNPDRQLRRGEIQYLVWDSFSARRAPFFADRLLAYAAKYRARAVHTETIAVRTATGRMQQPVITIYEVSDV
ncbi:MAG TPA: glycosyltransferase family 39 protein, partial [Mycobacteriales bacterium]|nr:glycosyltransferase family 39 protein [Mycobacteriales bacterium]